MQGNLKYYSRTIDGEGANRELLGLSRLEKAEIFNTEFFIAEF